MISSELTVVVPVSNMAGKLTNLSKWLLESSRSSNIRVILVHDIRDGLTSSELRTLTSKCKNVQLIENYFGNPGSARNEGLRHVKTEWVTFWDSDDVPIWEKYLEIIRKMKSEDMAIGEYSTQSTTDLIIEHHRIDNTSYDNLIDHILKNPGVWRMLFRSSKISGTKFAETKMGEDQYLLFNLNLSKEKFFVFTENIYFYLTNQESQLTKSPIAADELFKTLKLEVVCLNRNPFLANDFNYSLLAGQILTIIYRNKWKLSINKFVTISKLLLEHPKILSKLPHIIKLRIGK
jgi:glycosyltransferase involved in cell wall biosynthesis